MDFEIKPIQLGCAAEEINYKTYNLYIGNSGLIWLIADVENAADYIYCSSPGKSLGFNGRTLEFCLDNGDSIKLQGPWLSTAHALHQNTGIYVSDKHKTFGVISERFSGQTMFNVLYQDKEPMIGELNRIKDICQIMANQLKRKLYYYQQSTIKTKVGRCECSS